nr:hypothetical protein [Tanacetum cinerariifolium]
GESVYANSLCRSQGHTVADSYAETSKDPVYITMNFFETKALETKISQLKEGLTSLKIQNDGYKALETELTQLKDTVTSLKIQNDGYKVTNANFNRCYEEFSKANTHLRTTSLEKIGAQKAEITTLNAKTVGNKTSGTTKPANPKVIAPGMYTISPKEPPSLHLDSQRNQ